MLCFFLPSFFHGVSRSTLHALATASAMRKTQPSPRAIADAQGAIAPAADRERGVVGTTSAASTSCCVPSPLHAWHMPSGLLNEKLCGESSGKLWPQQARFSLKASSLAAVASRPTTQLPLPFAQRELDALGEANALATLSA